MLNTLSIHLGTWVILPILRIWRNLSWPRWLLSQVIASMMTEWSSRSKTIFFSVFEAALHMVSLRWVTRSVMTLLQEESTQGRGCGAEPLSLEYSRQLTTERAFLSSLWWQGCFSKGSEIEDFYGSVQANTQQPHSINRPGIWVSHSCCLRYTCLNWQPEDDSVFFLVDKSSISKQMMRK